MILKPLELIDLELARQWRMDITETLRTSYFLNRRMQEDFYEEVLSNRYGNTRYWGFWEDTNFIGMGGLENIEQDNRRAEISILINPNYRGMGFGKICVDKIIEQGFQFMNLEYIWGECFECANYKFWEKIIAERKAESTWLPARKYWNGKYWKSLYFTIKREAV
jgi:RimJ/RimL family protein N-acetyltransferase